MPLSASGQFLMRGKNKENKQRGVSLSTAGKKALNQD
jgi:hypothetical protein